MPIAKPVDLITCVASGSTGSTDRWANVISLKRLGSVTIADLFDAMHNFYQTLVADQITPVNWSYDSLVITEYNFDPPVVHDFTETVHQATANDPLPSQCALVISWKTGRAGKSYRGRTYIGSLNRGILDGGDVLVNPSSVSAVADAAGTLITAMEAANAPVAVWSRKHVVTTQVTGINVGRVVDTQRRRRNQQPG